MDMGWSSATVFTHWIACNAAQITWTGIRARSARTESSPTNIDIWEPPPPREEPPMKT